MTKSNQYNKNGKETGVWKFYHDNGKLRDIGKFKNGREIGVWKVYDRNGKLIETRKY